MSDYLLSVMSIYGLSVLCLALLIGSIGIPMPATLMLIVSGSFVSQGEFSLWQTLVFASISTILGDNIGYAIGRYGGHKFVHTLGNRVGIIEQLKHAEEWTRRWGGVGIFFSRWLITPLGPWLNLTAGISNYPWHRFLFFDIAGELVWVSLYVLLGLFFSERVQALSELLGNTTWVILGIVVIIFLSRRLFQYLRSSDVKEEIKLDEKHISVETAN